MLRDRQSVCLQDKCWSARSELDAKFVFLVPHHPARPHGTIGIKHDVEMVGNADRACHAQTGANRRYVADGAPDHRVMLIEQNARRLVGARALLTTPFHVSASHWDAPAC